jgi:putative transposase
VLGFFRKTKSAARKAYCHFVDKGVSQGRRHELTGGGLVRSLDEWTAFRALRGGSVRIKREERILGDSNFAEAVLRDADEQLDLLKIMDILELDFNNIHFTITKALPDVK